MQLTEAGVIEDVFSLCFGGVSGGGALLMGDVPLPPGGEFTHAGRQLMSWFRVVRRPKTPSLWC